MTTQQIEAQQKLSNLKFAAAVQIRVILDKVKEAHGDDADDIEEAILALVTD